MKSCQIFNLLGWLKRTALKLTCQNLGRTWTPRENLLQAIGDDVLSSRWFVIGNNWLIMTFYSSILSILRSSLLWTIKETRFDLSNFYSRLIKLLLEGALWPGELWNSSKDWICENQGQGQLINFPALHGVHNQHLERWWTGCLRNPTLHPMELRLFDFRPNYPVKTNYLLFPTNLRFCNVS